MGLKVSQLVSRASRHGDSSLCRHQRTTKFRIELDALKSSARLSLPSAAPADREFSEPERANTKRQ